MAAEPDQDLYFILNPTVGIIKIGVTADVPTRLLALEHACGMPLELLGVLPRGARYERDLHAAFWKARLRGEWFSPSVALLQIAEAPGLVPAFVAEQEYVIRSYHEAMEAERAAARAGAREEKLAAKKALRELEEKKARIRREREERAEARKKAAAEALRAATAEEMKRWRERSPELVGRVVDTGAAATAEDRSQWLATQRGRNAAMVGVRGE